MKVEVKIIQSCLTLCDPMDYAVHGILQARILEWVAFPSPGDLPNPGIQPRSPALWADSLPAELRGKPSITQQLFGIFFPGRIALNLLNYHFKTSIVSLKCYPSAYFYSQQISLPFSS